MIGTEGLPSGISREQHLAAFRALVAVLVEMSDTHPDKKVRRAAVQSLCAFAMLHAEPGGPDTLDGPEVTKLVECAVLAITPPEPSAHVL